MKKQLALITTICILLLSIIGCSKASENQTIDISKASQESPFSDIAVDSNGHLIITMEDGSVFDVGNIKGEKGDKGEPGQDGAAGKDGKNGKDGVDGKAGDNGIDGRDGADGANGLSSNGVIMLADCQIGMSFPCNPIPEFDCVLSDDHGNDLGIIAHINTVSVVLSEKNNSKTAYEQFRITNRYDSFYPYGVTVTVAGTTDSSLAGKYFQVNLIGNSMLGASGLITENGTFIAESTSYGFTTLPSELWLSTPFISDTPGE